MNSFVFPTKVNIAIESSLTTLRGKIEATLLAGYSLTQLKKHSFLQSFYGTEIVKKSISKCRNSNSDKVEFRFGIKLKK